MKNLLRIVSAVVLVLLVSSVLLIVGCGRKQAESEGCPAGSYVANSTDTLTGPEDATFSTAPCAIGATYVYPPLIYTVLDADNNPRNNVCIAYYTDGFWYSDNDYTTIVPGFGFWNRIVSVTDDSGRAKALYWSTELLPNANPVVSSGTGTAITFTAGDDQSGTSFVTAESGALSKTYNVNWTVKGCQP